MILQLHLPLCGDFVFLIVFLLDFRGSFQRAMALAHTIWLEVSALWGGRGGGSIGERADLMESRRKGKVEVRKWLSHELDPRGEIPPRL